MTVFRAQPFVCRCSNQRRQTLFIAMLIVAIALLALVIVANAASIKDRWNFAWDAHSQATQIARFDLEICVQSRCWIMPIPGGSTVMVNWVFIDPAIPGTGTAVLRACLADGRCSGNSNTVVLDRTPPAAPSAAYYESGFNNQR